MRQLSFAFLQSRRHTTELPVGIAPSQPVTLRKIDPAKNMARFYALEVERNLFGRVVLARGWGRIGTAGKIRLDEHTGEGDMAFEERRVTVFKPSNVLNAHTNGEAAEGED